MSNKRRVIEYALIVLGSAVYAVSTVLFIFPHALLLGGTSGISVILTEFLPFSPGIILSVINVLLIVLALVILGKGMAIRTLVGSVCTTLFVSLFEAAFINAAPIISSPLWSAVVGSFLIALSSGIMFYVDSSSGGTDVIALIIKKFSNIKIGLALLITDALIVIVGGILSGLTVAICSVVGLLIKTLGIDLVIKIIVKVRKNAAQKREKENERNQ